ncbi:hypothetical protein [Vibrio metschnikovii]|uniref:hypothetical protein n=1 Tax=Vibrio metschnikovii TaxID=28172 RepID=UPI001C30BAC7|nr:hypothetical protein [Vibrio metschnikovii]
MINHIKKLLPKSIKTKLLPIKAKLVDNPKKRKLFLYMQNKHQELLQEIKGKEKIKVVFLAIHKSVWKVDPVFKKMLDDPYFEPVILICPYVQYGKERMLEDLKAAYEYFDSKGYPVISSYNEQNGTWVQLEDLKPDILFFTNPHNLTRPEYYEEAYKKYLSLYVPYYFMTTDHAGDADGLYNTRFLLAMFKVFWPSEYHKSCQNNYSINKATNGVGVGYSATECFSSEGFKNPNVWKHQLSARKKIIFAPHHTIEGNEKSLSSFLLLADFMKELAVKYSDSVQWSFKPHPILKSKLYQHNDWGIEKTERYYQFWQENEYTQLDEGEYEDLFYFSDAIIHDSSSFIAEYVFTGKPALYLMAPDKVNTVVNDFGKMFLLHYRISDKQEDIIQFIENVIIGKADAQDNIQLKNYINHYYVERKPSELIIEEIKRPILVNYEK